MLVSFYKIVLYYRYSDLLYNRKQTMKTYIYKLIHKTSNIESHQHVRAKNEFDALKAINSIYAQNFIIQLEEVSPRLFFNGIICD